MITAATDLAGSKLPAALATEHIHRLLITPSEAAERAGEWFRGPGARRRTLAAVLADPPAAHRPVPELRVQLLARPGIGPWTAGHALLRGVRAIDVAPARDVALLTSARALGLAGDFTALGTCLQAASPWRSYAVMHLCHHPDERPPEHRTPRKENSCAPYPTTTPPPTPHPPPPTTTPPP